jgi:hypothetical protein
VTAPALLALTVLLAAPTAAQPGLSGPVAVESPFAVEGLEPTRAYAVIVANDRGDEPGMGPLRYADDDGARYRELFLAAGVTTELLAVLDAETQRLYPESARAARAPTRSELETVLESVFAAIGRDNQAGLRTVLYFVYAGHGSVGADGEGAMHLLDGRFTRSDLFQRVVSRSPARINHLIIDACNAYLMVARRGAGAPTEAAIASAVSGFLSREGLERHPNTGVLVSTSQAADVHEWERFQAGIFSHEVRSALAGGADVDGDGAVSYDEARAFLAAANGRVADARARIRAYALPPAIHRAEPLFDRRFAKAAPMLRIPASLTGRRYLEDARGVRFADFNIGADGPLVMMLVPSSTYFLRSAHDEIRIPLEGRHPARAADAGALNGSPIELAQRGSESLAFQRDLFAIPFGRSYFEGFVAHAEVEPPPAALLLDPVPAGLSSRHAIALGLAGSGLVAAGVGLGFGLSASNQAASYRSAIGSNDDVGALRTGASQNAQLANILFGAAGAALVSGAVVWLWPAD